LRRPKSVVGPKILLVSDTWSGARVGRRQLVAMGVALVLMSAAAFVRGDPLLALVGLLGPSVVAADRFAGGRRWRRARG
jgi:hypothetical protein